VSRNSQVLVEQDGGGATLFLLACDLLGCGSGNSQWEKQQLQILNLLSPKNDDRRRVHLTPMKESGNSPIHHAAASGCESAVAMLLDEYGDEVVMAENLHR